MVIQKAALRSKVTTNKLRKGRDGITSTLFNPVRQPLLTINLESNLIPFMKTLTPQPQYVQIWSLSPQPSVNSAFGPVPIGSVLSYQQPCTEDRENIIINNAPTVPTFSLPHLTQAVNTVLNYDEYHLYEGLFLTKDDSVEYEIATKSQAQCGTWHDLRKHRLTASTFKRITGRRRDYETLADNLLSSKNITTAAIRHGIQHESIAAELYADLYQRNVYRVGFVINPSARHLGSSPDRIVYDSEIEEFGLLEIKCPISHSYEQCSYLTLDNGVHSLKIGHAYYEQINGQLGLTGMPWCDFFVCCQDNFFKQRIMFDEALFVEMKKKLDSFYFDVFLPAAVRNLKEC